MTSLLLDMGNFSKGSGTKGETQVLPFLSKFCNPADSHVDFRDFVPGREIYHSCLGQLENFLESLDGICCFLSKYAVFRYFWKQWVSLGDDV